MLFIYKRNIKVAIYLNYWFRTRERYIQAALINPIYTRTLDPHVGFTFGPFIARVKLLSIVSTKKSQNQVRCIECVMARI